MLRSAKFILILMALMGCANPLFYRAVPEEMISLAAPEMCMRQSVFGVMNFLK